MRRSRDPKSQREVRRQARVLLEAAERGDADAAHVLLDVLQMLPEANEHPAYGSIAYAIQHLALAVHGRNFPGSGAPETDAERAEIMRRALLHVRGRVFPRRVSPCMPDRRRLMRLFESVHGSTDPAESANDRRLFAELWNLIQEICRSNRGYGARSRMEHVDDLLRGDGVVYLQRRTRRAGIVTAFYIRREDPDDATLIWFISGQRFFITSPDEFIAYLDRRFGQSADPLHIDPHDDDDL